MIEIDWFHSEEISAVFLIKAVQQYAIEILVKLRGSVFDQHLHLVNQLCLNFAILALCRAICRQIFTADCFVAFRARGYYNLSWINWVDPVDAEAGSEVVPISCVLWQTLKVEEQILQPVEHKWLVACALLRCWVSSDISKVHSAHQHFR